MKNKIIVALLIMLVLLFSQNGLANVLDSDQIKIVIHIGEMIEVDFDDKSLDLDLAVGVSSEKEFKIKSNFPLTVSFESKKGFGEDINDLFEYVIIYYKEGEEKEAVFKPGAYLPTGIIEMEPGEKKWKMIIRLREDIAEQWQLLLKEGIENIETIDMDTEWTNLEPGVYTDLLTITFHKLDIDQYMIEKYE
ncbi:MAG: hypothetical protein ACQEQD_08745 [Bacillota bacterium]